jgi:hypothetical protein
MRARFRQAASSALAPVASFVMCAGSAAAAIPAARSASIVLLTAALVGIVAGVACLVAWVLHADRRAAAREALADPMHLKNWWPDFERQFWSYLEDEPA